MKSEGFRAFVEELFEPVEGAMVRPMFGGLGIFREGIMFALGADEVLYFRADGETEPAFAAEGSQPWVYEGRDRAVTMPYWRVPERLLDDRDEFRTWALTAFAAAERAKAGKPKGKSENRASTKANAKVGATKAKSGGKPSTSGRAKTKPPEGATKAKPSAKTPAGSGAKSGAVKAGPSAKAKARRAPPAAAKSRARSTSKPGGKARPGR
jgi:DNA transformation protein